jgi:hypothetical protein
MADSGFRPRTIRPLLRLPEPALARRSRAVRLAVRAETRRVRCMVCTHGRFLARSRRGRAMTALLPELAASLPRPAARRRACRLRCRRASRLLEALALDSPRVRVVALRGRGKAPRREVGTPGRGCGSPCSPVTPRRARLGQTVGLARSRWSCADSSSVDHRVGKGRPWGAGRVGPPPSGRDVAAGLQRGGRSRTSPFQDQNGVGMCLSGRSGSR